MQPMTRAVIIRVALAMVGIGLVVTVGGSAQLATGSSTGQVQILSLKDGQHIGAEGDGLCSSAPQPCFKIRAEGRVPEERFPFFAVEPVLVSPKMWIQPLIHRVRQDGSFSGLVYLGKEDNGAQQYFKIYLFACDRPDRFSEGDTMFKPPTDCLVSDPVEVYRER